MDETAERKTTEGDQSRSLLTEKKKAIVQQPTRNPKLDTVRWDVRARCDIQLMWQITMGDGMDIFQKEKTGLFVNTWTPTEADLKLLSLKPYPDKKGNDEINTKKSSAKFRVEVTSPLMDNCGKYSCYFDEGCFLYLE